MIVNESNISQFRTSSTGSSKIMVSGNKLYLLTHETYNLVLQGLRVISKWDEQVTEGQKFPTCTPAADGIAIVDKLEQTLLSKLALVRKLTPEDRELLEIAKGL